MNWPCCHWQKRKCWPGRGRNCHWDYILVSLDLKELALLTYSLFLYQTLPLFLVNKNLTSKNKTKTNIFCTEYWFGYNWPEEKQPAFFKSVANGGQNVSPETSETNQKPRHIASMEKKWSLIMKQDSCVVSWVLDLNDQKKVQLKLSTFPNRLSLL